MVGVAAEKAGSLVMACSGHVVAVCDAVRTSVSNLLVVAGYGTANSGAFGIHHGVLLQSTGGVALDGRGNDTAELSGGAAGESSKGGDGELHFGGLG